MPGLAHSHLGMPFGRGLTSPVAWGERVADAGAGVAERLRFVWILRRLAVGIGGVCVPLGACGGLRRQRQTASVGARRPLRTQGALAAPTGSCDYYGGLLGRPGQEQAPFLYAKGDSKVGIVVVQRAKIGVLNHRIVAVARVNVGHQLAVG